MMHKGKFIAAAAVLLLASCGDSSGSSSSTSEAAEESKGKTIRVPDDFKTITEAVESAEAGDMVLVG